MNAAEHIDTAKAAIARGKAQDATAHALIAIAEQGQPVEHAIDLAEHERQQPPVLLTERQVALAAEWLQAQTAIASAGYCRTLVMGMIRHANEASR